MKTVLNLKVVKLNHIEEWNKLYCIATLEYSSILENTPNPIAVQNKIEITLSEKEGNLFSIGSILTLANCRDSDLDGCPSCGPITHKKLY
jgi:hypothetical protein